MQGQVVFQQSKWSENLKSKKVKINGHFIRLNQESNSTQFVLFEYGFIRQNKIKRCWALTITKKTGGIRLGVCLKKVIEKHNFNFKKIDWFQIGHGCYAIHSGGEIYSHTLKEYNCVDKGFEFDQRDVIYLEYDPIQSLLRFRKNENGAYFNMPICQPPIGDAYHPFVQFYTKDTRVKFITPGKPLS